MTKWRTQFKRSLLCLQEQNQYMLTAKLIDTVAAGNLTAAAKCLEEGGKPNTLSGDGATAMHIAAGVGVDAVRLMLAYGGDPNVRSVDGSTPLHVAAAWGDKDTLRLLLHNGANPTIVDHEGQRAVDVARSEEHTACVDFLKYYIMLVAVGDEEESPMYTSELIDTTQGDIPHGSTSNCPSPCTCHPQPAHQPTLYSSDEEEPINLSGQYTDALSRQLSRLLNDGNNACLDVTSPDCPYIGDKHDTRHGGGDRTLLAEGSCIHFPDLIDSDSSENNLAFPEGCCCHSNHCCLHDQSKQSSHVGYGEKPVHCEEHYVDSPGSPEYYDTKFNYARNIERKMRQKYFPDLGKDHEIRGRGRILNFENRSADGVTKHCTHSYFRSLSPQQAKPLKEWRVGSASSHELSPVHSQDQTSHSGTKAMYRGTGCPLKAHQSPLVSDREEESLSCHHHLQRLSASPNREHGQKHRESCSSPQQKQSHSSRQDSLHHRQRSSHMAQKQLYSPQSKKLHHAQRLCHSAQRGGLQSEFRISPQHNEAAHHCRIIKESHCSSVCASSHCHQKYSSLFPSCSVLHHSLSDHSRQDCHNEWDHPSAVSKSLRKLPAEKSHLCMSRDKSPVTIMHVQSERGCPPPGMFRPSVHFPFSQSSPVQDQPEFTIIPGDYKKDVPVAESCSSQSVDSGYCEKCTTKQQLGVDAITTVPGSKLRSTGNGAEKSALSALCIDETSPDNRHISQNKKTVECTDTEFHFISQEDPQKIQVNMLPTLEDDCSIVSSNLRGRNHRSNLLRHSRQVHSACKADEPLLMRGEACREEPEADLSVSSSDSFQTCEEASVQDGGYDRSSQRSHRQNSKIQPDQLDETRKCRNVSSQSTKAVTDVKEQEKVSSCMHGKNQEMNIKTESLGFSVSVTDESQDDHSSLPRKNTDTARYFSTSPPENNNSPSRKMHRTGKHIGMKTSKDCIPARDPAASSSLQNQQSLADVKCLSHHHKSWLPPSEPLPDDSDLLTSDESFMARSQGQQTNNGEHIRQSSNVSRWLQNNPAATPDSKRKNTKHIESKSMKRTSDESIISITSSVQEYIYCDKENGITLIERHIPSDFSGSSGRPSLESVVSLDTDATVSYDWADFTINSNQTLSSSSSSFDITAGQTMKSQETLRTNDSDSCHDDCSARSDHEKDCNDEDLEENKGKSKQKRNMQNSPKKAETDAQKINEENTKTSSKPTTVTSKTDNCVSSNDVAIPPDLAALSDEAIFQSLKDLGEDPGPVLPSTRQTYLQLLASVQSGQHRIGLSSSKSGFSSELNRLLAGSLDMENLAKEEMMMVSQFQSPDGRTWREGTIKSSFNYLLLDPRVTKNLPLQAKMLGDTEAFKIFLSAVFYIGKGKRSRPYCHLYEAISQQTSPKLKVSQKVQQILDIWSAGLGVVSLHCFQNVIPVEAYTREACMVDAIGSGRLTNMKKGDYYGVASTWPTTRRRSMGAYLLRKAFQIFLSEGERQICPFDIQKGK